MIRRALQSRPAVRSTTGRAAALAAVLLALGATVAGAQPPLDPTAMSLADLMAAEVDHVYGASKFLQKVTDAPASVTVVSADEIRLYGYRTLADVLRSVAGISISYDRNYSYLGMRGLSRPGDLNSRVLVLIDGHRMNNVVDDQAALGTDFQLDVDLIDRVEVIRGPSAALYGSTAFAAVVAVITKQGHELDGLEASASVASLQTTHERVSWGKRYPSGLELLFSGSTHRTDGAARLYFPEFDAAATNGGFADHADGDRADTLALAAAFGNFTVHSLYAARTKQVPTASFKTLFNSGREETFDGRSSIDLQYTREAGRSVTVLARLYADRSVYDGYYPYAAASPDDASGPVINRDHFYGLWWGGEFDVSRRLWMSHTLTLGTEFRQNVEQSTSNYDESPRTVYIDHHPRSYLFALNAQDSYTVNRHVLVNLAAREERLATGETGFRPKAGVILTPRSGTTVKLLFSRALRAASAYEQYYNSPANAGNTTLTPERIEAFELNLEHYLTPAMKIDASLFRNTYRDLIVDVAEQSGTVTLQNGLNAEARGLELSWSLKRPRLRARGSYSTIFDSDAASNAWTSGAPKYLTKANVGWPIAPLALEAGFEAQYESDRHSYTGDVLAPAWLVNLNVVRSHVVKGLDLKVSLFNLLDQRFSEPVSENHRQGAIAQDGRQVLVGLTWRSQ